MDYFSPPTQLVYKHSHRNKADNNSALIPQKAPHHIKDNNYLLIHLYYNFTNLFL